MKIHNLVQGSPEWLAFRAQHFGASDAPAMMGVSPYKTRQQLLREKATGITPDVSPEQQAIMDSGHRFEALARPLAEEVIGEELYPVTCSEGRLSASMDGFTLLGDVNWEHKRLNKRLRAAFDEIEASATPGGRCLPEDYRVQLEHQQAVGGTTRTLFSASDWTDSGELIEIRHCVYQSDPELRARIIAGWAQFEADLKAYQPEAAVEVVTAAAQEHLPAPSVRVSGALAVASNLDVFGAALRAFVARIPKKPSTDQEFADTEAACKRLKDAEDKLQSEEDSALARMPDVNAMRQTVAELRELARQTRLAAEKLVKARKEEIRTEVIGECVAGLRAHINGLNEKLGGAYMPTVAADFPGAIKGLKSISSVRDKAAAELARAKTEATMLAEKIGANLALLDSLAEGRGTLFPDRAALVLKAADDLTAIIKSRIAEHDAQEAARAEAQAAAAQVQAQQVIARAAAPAAAPIPVPAVAPADEPATLKLGVICERLGFTVNAAFLSDTLHIQPAKTEGASRLYTERQFAQICSALVSHVNAMAVLYAAGASA